MSRFSRLFVGVFVVSSLLIPVSAAVRASATRPGNWMFPQGAVATVPLTTAGATTLTFSGSGKHMITYSAECAVSSASSLAWLTIEIILDGVALPPTAGTVDAFCSGNGTAGFDGWTTHTISVPTPTLPTGTHTLVIQASLQSGVAGDSGWLGDSSLVVTK
jgi:hypothetical protein